MAERENKDLRCWVQFEQFFNLRLQKNQQGTPSQGDSNQQ